MTLPAWIIWTIAAAGLFACGYALAAQKWEGRLKEQTDEYRRYGAKIFGEYQGDLLKERIRYDRLKAEHGKQGEETDRALDLIEKTTGWLIALYRRLNLRPRTINTMGGRSYVAEPFDWMAGAEKPKTGSEAAGLASRDIEMQTLRALDLIFEELRKAKESYPKWPGDPVHAAAIMAEEAGETVEAALDYYYGREEGIGKIQKEAAQTGAMALRLLIGIDEVALKDRP